MHKERTVQLETNLPRPKKSTANERHYPMDMRIYGPSKNEEPYRNQRASKNGFSRLAVCRKADSAAEIQGVHTRR